MKACLFLVFTITGFVFGGQILAPDEDFYLVVTVRSDTTFEEFCELFRFYVQVSIFVIYIFSVHLIFQPSISFYNILFLDILMHPARDFGSNEFNPDGSLQQVDFASKAAESNNTAVGVVGKTCVVLVTKEKTGHI